MSRGRKRRLWIGIGCLVARGDDRSGFGRGCRPGRLNRFGCRCLDRQSSGCANRCVRTRIQFHRARIRRRLSRRVDVERWRQLRPWLGLPDFGNATRRYCEQASDSDGANEDAPPATRARDTTRSRQHLALDFLGHIDVFHFQADGWPIPAPGRTNRAIGERSGGRVGVVPWRARSSFVFSTDGTCQLYRLRGRAKGYLSEWVKEM